jgi:phosphoribosylaminoimidazole-succinocarboxamide synthase
MTPAMESCAVMRTELPLGRRRQGKVRDIYEAQSVDGRSVLVIVASDRISAFDVVMANGVPGKGVVLTQMSRFWFELIAERLGDRVPHHLLSTDPFQVRGLTAEQARSLEGRVMVGRRCRVVPIECVVRGYLAGSGWKEYEATGRVCGVSLPAGLRMGDRLPEPIFTPATKAEHGHDENIDFGLACAIAGEALAHRLRDMSLAVYRLAHEHAASRGIILADTKFEFGLPLDEAVVGAGESRDPTPLIIDEVLTPDSSRFWPADAYRPGREQPSFDKQFVRDYLQRLVNDGGWDREPPGPALPLEVVRQTLEKYLDAYRRLTGRELHV